MILSILTLWTTIAAVVAVVTMLLNLPKRMVVIAAITLPPLWAGGMLLVLWQPWTYWVFILLLLAGVGWLLRKHRAMRVGNN